ncbi:MAG TPA: hypothetical protein VM261_07290 [Kofleriaceae bacterium]|nr:hypothetical protein [Kofleriaceae bacterium]
MSSLRLALVPALLASAACASGAPPGFSSGNAWVFPLVGPLENGALIAPVTFGAKGPYLFVIDPDASASSLDESLAGELGLVTALGPRLIDEGDTSRPTKVAEVPAMTVGTLTVKGRVVTLHANGVYATDGRAIRGVIGRDVVADSLVFGFDRDAGVAFLATRESFAAPATSMRIAYDREVMKRGDIEPSSLGGPTGTVPRRVAKAKVNGSAVELHLDLGAVQSQLAPGRWKAARLAPVPYKVSAIDEVATVRNVDKAGIANHVELGDASAMGLVMIPYGDKRFDEEDVHGTLGLNFFAPYKVWADWHDHAVYLVPRDGELEGVGDRIARWNAPVLMSCKDPACATARLEAADAPADAPAEAPVQPPADPAAGAPVPPEPEPPTLVVTREDAVASLAYELLVEAVGADGQPLGLPRLVATFVPGAKEIRQKLSPAFAGARFRVLDVSPFIRVCPKPDAGCVFELTATR